LRINYTNDSGKGIAKAWRENGKLIYLIIEVKMVVRYGLQNMLMWLMALKDREVYKKLHHGFNMIKFSFIRGTIFTRKG